MPKNRYGQLQRPDFNHGDRVALAHDKEGVLCGNIVTDQAAWYSFFDSDNKLQNCLAGKAPDAGMVAVLWDETPDPVWIYDYDLRTIWKR